MHKRGRSAQLTPLSGLASLSPSPCFLFLFSFLYFFYPYSYSFFLVISSALPLSRFEVCLLYANAFICSQFGAHPCRSSAYLLPPFLLYSFLPCSLSFSALSRIAFWLQFISLFAACCCRCCTCRRFNPFLLLFSVLSSSSSLSLFLSVLFGQAIRCCLGSVCARQLAHRRLRSVSST